MIKKAFELNAKVFELNKIFLLYGLNDGAKNEIIDELIQNSKNKNIGKYNEKEIIENQDQFIEGLLSKSLFDENKIIIINYATDKILKVVEKITSICDENTKIILNSDALEKKSKLRIFFERNKNLICIPFYLDEIRALIMIAQKYLAEMNISISTSNINLIVNKCHGNRKILKNELEKIRYYTAGNKKLKTEDIIKLINLIDNHNVDELTNNYLAKSKKKILEILNENNYVPEDTVIIIRNLLIKSKKLLILVKDYNGTKNLNKTIDNFRPPIFWKDKEIIGKQILKWNEYEVKKLIYKIAEIEFDIKKNYKNSVNIINNFFLEDFRRFNNCS